ncbi:hypothetical protein DXG03_005383, partial [Asterophora parasitica]
MPSAETTLSYIAAALSFLTVFTPFVLYVKYSSPAAFIRYFDELLIDTKQIYTGAVAEGLLPPQMSAKAGAKLRRYQVAGDVLRSAKFNTLSLSQILRSYIKFNSNMNKIKMLSKGLTSLRTNILTASQEERQRRAAQHIPPGDEDASILHGSFMDLMFISESSHVNGEGAPVHSQIQISSNNTTDGPTILRLSSDAPPPSSPCSICLLKHWISVRCSRRTKPSSSSVGQTLDNDQEIESPSRSATLVEELPPSGRHSRWWRPEHKAGAGMEDIEAARPVSKSSEYLDSEAFPLEPSQMEMDITSIVA